MSYCKLCEGIIPWLKKTVFNCFLADEPAVYVHHQRLIDIELSAAEDCPLCRMILGTFSQSQLESRRQYEEQEGSNPFIFTFDIDTHDLMFDGSASGCHVRMQFYSPPISGRVIPKISTQSAHLPSHPLDTNLLQRLMIYCIETDPDCCRMARDDYLPRRLIDVGPPDGSTEPVLVETFALQNDLEPGAALNSKFLNRDSNFILIEHPMPLTHYVTLSHCWGSTAHAVTTTSNLSMRKKGIPMAELNKTFQDAVTVVRYLEVQYLWIDALCILQDSVEDWAKESREMHLVYNNAVVNIAAISSSNSNEGFLYERLPGCELPLSHASDPGLETTNLWLRPLSPVEDGPLDRRAWVFQESILAPRTLSFGRHEAFFRCRTHRYSEKSLQEVKYNYRLGSYFLDRQSDYQGSEDEMYLRFAKIVYEGINTPEKLQKAYNMWRRVVEVYSEKDLTFIKDKLPAIAGIATQFGTFSKDRYVAGLWEADLPRSLLWFAFGERPAIEHDQYIAPSWSWASQPGPVYYSPLIAADTHAAESHVQILEVIVESAEDNVYGQILNGHLRLRGKLLREISLKRNELGDLYLEQENRAIQSNVLFLDDPKMVAEEELWCLLVATDLATDGNDEVLTNYALLLRREENESLKFKRVGIAGEMEPVSLWEAALEMDITIL